MTTEWPAFGDGVMVNRFDPTHADMLNPSDRDLLDRRRRVLGDLYPLFYDIPLRVARGEGCRLFDQEGREYLDAYNNVPAVGHANPRVADAVARQLRQVNTHTRYLHTGIVDYAERLLATFPAHLDRVVFSNSGSEANDLAVRLAQWRTGNTGVIVTSNAYHGTSALLAGLSPENGSMMPLMPFVRLVAPPDTYREGEDAATRFAESVDRAIDDLRRHGHGLAGLLIDSIMSTDGIYADPPGLLAEALDRVHAAGGLVIADEVQPGLGRTGDHWWGFEHHTQDVDISTCGKPMAGGLPLGTLVTTADLSDGYAAKARYFNTFGGNPACIAAANAVLDEIDERQLRDNARHVGALLRSRIGDVTAQDGRIGDVRGSGLFVGVEVVTDRVDRRPDGATARRIVSGLRDRQVLISAVGREGHVLKIRPPLVFTADDAELLVRALDDTLGSIAPA